MLLVGPVPAEVARTLERWGFRPSSLPDAEAGRAGPSFLRGQKGVIVDGASPDGLRLLRQARGTGIPTVVYNTADVFSTEAAAGTYYRTYPGPEELRRALTRLASFPLPEPNMAIDPAPFEEFLKERYGIVFPSRRTTELREAVRERLTVLRIASTQAYLNRLRALADPADREADHLVASLTVGETYLYRTPSHYDALRRQKLPSLLAEKGTEPVRALSAGCSTGEEAYCLGAILLDLFPPEQVEVIGADVSRAALEIATEGRYSGHSLRSDMPREIARHFETVDGAVSPGAALRRRTSFVYLNLASWAEGRSSGPSGPFDVIFCRNVLLYFDPPRATAILRLLASRLRAGGVLFLGPSETVLGGETDLRVVAGPDCFYLEKPGPRLAAALGGSPPARPAGTGEPPAPSPPSRPPSKPHSAGIDLAAMASSPSRSQPPGRAGARDPMGSSPPARPGSSPPSRPGSVPVRPGSVPPSRPGSSRPIDGESPVDTLVRRGFRKLDEEDFQAAERCFETAAREDVAALGPRIGYLYLKANQGEYDQAFAGCVELASGGATRPELYYLMGLLADLKGDTPMARREFERALFLDTGCFMARFRLAEIYCRLASWAEASREARNLLEQLRNLAPGSLVPLSGGMSREGLEALCLGLLKSDGAGVIAPR